MYMSADEVQDVEAPSRALTHTEERLEREFVCDTEWINAVHLARRSTYYDRDKQEYVAVHKELRGYGGTMQDAIDDLNDHIINEQLSGELSC